MKHINRGILGVAMLMIFLVGCQPKAELVDSSGVIPENQIENQEINNDVEVSVEEPEAVEE